MSFENVGYEDLPEDSPDVLKLSVDLEKYLEEEGLSEFKDEVLELEEEISEKADMGEFTDAKKAVAAAYRAVTGETYLDVAFKFNLYEENDEEGRNALVSAEDKLDVFYRRAGFDELELFDEYNKVHNRRRKEYIEDL